MSDVHRGARAGLCPRCGALNGADFDRCIRCNAALSVRALSADRMKARAGGESLLGTKAVLLATTVIFTLQFTAALGQRLPLFEALLSGSSKDALRFGALLLLTDYVLAEPWRLISAIFVHYGALHFLMNMLSLANLGRVAEPAVGTARFLTAYLCTGVIGFAATVVYSHFLGGSFGTTAGASGAVLGVMGIILGWMIRRRDPRWKDFAAQALFYGVLFGFVINASSMGVMVNNSAHIGGLLSGTLFGAIYAGHAGPRPRSDLWANLLAGVAVIACVVSLLLPHWSPLSRKTRWLSEAPVAPAPVVQRDDGATASPGRTSARPG